MINMTFYEKPGCINGEKQKKILRDAGNQLNCINILEEKWQASTLLPFIQGKQPAEFMNYTAPAIKNGEIVPEKLQFDEAVALLIENPILINRPLIKVEEKFIQGFADQQLKPYLGNWKGEEDVITCPNLQTLSCDDKR